MKAFHLFFLFFICIGCTNQIQEKTDLLNEELVETPILSLSFDSLWQDVQKLPSRQQTAILLQISYRDEKELGGMRKLENLLLKGFPLASSKEKKKILLQLLELYKKLNERRDLNADIKGIQLSKELDTFYSFSKEEKWKIKKIKGLLLGRSGQHEQYLPIWFELLAEHRAANKPKFIIEDLLTIGNYLSILGDQEKAIALYQEAYQLAIEYHFSDLSNECLVQLIILFYDRKQYTEVLNYSNILGIDSVASLIPSAYPMLSACYLELQKPDSARFYLTKKNQTSVTGNGMILNCRIADTYIKENKIDSARLFLNKAMSQFQIQARHLKENNIEASLPFYFLPSYSSLASLYQENGNYQQADKSFTLIESLMKKATNDHFRLEMQANALARYSSFCRATKQYEKAVDLLMRRDSILQIVNNINKERESKNLIDRLQIKDLEHQINMQEVSLTNSHRMIAAISACALLFFLLICAIAYIYYQRKKRLTIIINQEKEREKEAEQSELSATSRNKKTLSPEEKLFRAAQKKVKSEKLYLQKDIKLETLAQELETNRSYLSSCINTCSGKNFNQWINDFRIDFLLEHIHSGEKLTELAAKAGFTSTDAFYRNFKRKTKLTPNEYLKRFN